MHTTTKETMENESRIKKKKKSIIKVENTLTKVCMLSTASVSEFFSPLYLERESLMGLSSCPLIC